MHRVSATRPVWWLWFAARPSLLSLLLCAAVERMEPLISRYPQRSGEEEKLGGEEASGEEASGEERRRGERSASINERPTQ